MPTTFTTKRPHRKSRAGCIGCKARKIKVRKAHNIQGIARLSDLKCDEKRPSCTFCATRELQCVYTRPESGSSPSSSSDTQSLVRRAHHVTSYQNQSWAPTPPSSCSPSPYLAPSLNPASAILTKTDMQLFHHYCVNTYRNLTPGGGESLRVLQVRIPEIAFESEHDFLMNGILAVASMHIDYLKGNASDDCEQTTLYRMRAIRTFREFLSSHDIVNRPSEAAAAMGVFLLVVGRIGEIPDQLRVMTWFGLFLGLSELIMTPSYPPPKESSIGPLFRRSLREVKSDPVVPSELIDMLRLITPDDPDFSALESYCTALDSLGPLYSSLKDDGCSDALTLRILTWPSFVPKPVVDLARSGRPRALVLIAYYLIFTKLVVNMWWWDPHMADQDLDAVWEMVPPNLRPLLTIPMKARSLSNSEDIKKLLLGDPLSAPSPPSGVVIIQRSATLC